MGANSFWLEQRIKRYEPEINLRRRPFFLSGSKFRLRIPLRTLFTAQDRAADEVCFAKQSDDQGFSNSL